MFKFIASTTLASLLGVYAFACAPLAQGLPPSELAHELEQIAQRIKDENSARYSAVNEILWQEVVTEVGSEGDCQAVRIQARANVIADVNGQQCIQRLTIVYGRSSMEILAFYKQTEESFFCF